MNRFVVPLLALVFGVFATGGCARKTQAAPPPSAVVEKGRQSYIKLCATCHGPAGNGYAADNAPSLRSPTFLATATNEFIAAGIAGGRPGTAMAAFGRAYGGPLVPEDVDAIVAFIREGGPPRVELPPGKVLGDPKRGKGIFDTMCVRCHGTPTQRSTAIHLANPALLATASDAFIKRAIEVGRPPTSMAAWKDALPGQQITDVVAYVRSLETTPPPPPPAPPPLPPAAPRTGPVVLNAKGRAPDFVLKDDRFVGIDQVKQAMDQKRRMVIADARPPSDWASMHITGAISTPYYDAKSLDDIPNDGTWVLAYCACPHHVSGEVVDALRKRGYKHTAVIDEGIFAWKTKGYPVVEAPGAAPTPAPPPMPPVKLPAPHR